MTAANLLTCAVTDERTSLAWDTRNPDPAQWRVLFIEYLEPEFLPGALTDAYTRVWYLGYTFWPGNAQPFDE